MSSQRFPISTTELLKVTLLDARWLMAQFLSITVPLYLLVVGIISVLENLPNFVEILLNFDVTQTRWLLPSPSILVWSGWHQFMICIFFSTRFREASSRLWMTPVFSFYLKLYLFCCFSVFFFVLTFVRLPLHPSLHWFLNTPAQLQRTFIGNPVVIAVGWTNFVFYLISSSVIIFLFWKTHYRYRIETLSDQRLETGLTATQCFTCGLCICLDTHGSDLETVI